MHRRNQRTLGIHYSCEGCTSRNLWVLAPREEYDQRIESELTEAQVVAYREWQEELQQRRRGRNRSSRQSRR